MRSSGSVGHWPLAIGHWLVALAPRLKRAHRGPLGSMCMANGRGKARKHFLADPWRSQLWRVGQRFLADPWRSQLWRGEPGKGIARMPREASDQAAEGAPCGGGEQAESSDRAVPGRRQADGSPRRRGVQSAHGQKFDGCPPLTRIARVVWRARQRNATRPMAARQAHPRSIGRRLVRQAHQVLLAPRWRHEGGIDVPTTRRTTQ